MKHMMLVFGSLAQVLTVVSTLVWGPEFGSSASCKNICVPVTSWLMWGRRREIQGSSWLVRYCSQNGESVLQRENYHRNKVGRLAGQSSGERHLLRIWASSLPTWWDERADVHKLYTDLHQHPLPCAHVFMCIYRYTHTHTPYMHWHKHTRNLNMLHSMSNLTHMIFKTADPLHHPITITDKGKLFDT